MIIIYVQQLKIHFFRTLKLDRQENFSLKHDCTVAKKKYDTLARVNKWVQLTENVTRWSWTIGVGGILWLPDRWVPGNARVRKSAWVVLSIVSYEIMYAIYVSRLTSHAWSLQSRDGSRRWSSLCGDRVQHRARFLNDCCVILVRAMAYLHDYAQH